jgi:hypothetical protein
MAVLASTEAIKTRTWLLLPSRVGNEVVSQVQKLGMHTFKKLTGERPSHKWHEEDKAQEKFYSQNWPLEMLEKKKKKKSNPTAFRLFSAPAIHRCTPEERTSLQYVGLSCQESSSTFSWWKINFSCTPVKKILFISSMVGFYEMNY